MPNELDYTRKGLINIQNIDDNECFKSSIARYVNPANHHPARISKSDQDFAKNLDIKDIKFPVKIIHKIEKKKIFIGISVFDFENKEKYLIHVSKKCWERRHDLLLIAVEEKRHYVIIKDFNTFIYDYT